MVGLLVLVARPSEENPLWDILLHGGDFGYRPPLLERYAKSHHRYRKWQPGPLQLYSATTPQVRERLGYEVGVPLIVEGDILWSGHDCVDRCLAEARPPELYTRPPQLLFMLLNRCKGGDMDEMKLLADFLSPLGILVLDT